MKACGEGGAPMRCMGPIGQGCGKTLGANFIYLFFRVGGGGGVSGSMR
jgi:hypothetical protein